MAEQCSSGFRVGIDENGLGPRLGPMLITAILARVTPEGAILAGRAARGSLARRLGDSKQLIAHGDVALGEAWARALVARGCGNGGASAEVATPDRLVHAIAADGAGTLRAPCPGHVESQCWSALGESFAAEDALVRTISRDLDRLAAKGIEITAVRSVIVCTRRLNDGADAGKNRFVMDLHAMERLVLELREVAGQDVHAVCGKVGGFGSYEDAFGPLSGRLRVTLVEGRARSAYHFPGVGQIAFVRDGDASDLCVAMASLVGKYLRDLLMARIVRFYRSHLADLPSASGYHDPVTTSFIEATRSIREAQRVPGDCFERRRLDLAPELR